MDPGALRELFSAVRGAGGGLSNERRFEGADLRGAFLLRANLAGGCFTRAKFDHANLSGARLAAADLSESSLKGIELNGADLTGADLRGADLTEARIEGVCFANANLCGVSLKFTRGKPASVAGMTLDHAAFVRSEMNDATLIELWRDGAVLDDLRNFSERVKHACGANRATTLVDVPNARDVAIAEARHRDAILPSLIPKPLADGASSRMHASLRPSASPSVGQAAAAGDRLLGVRLVELLGRGPNGAVWKAHDAEGRTVAVKIFEPRPEGGEAAAATFKRGVSTLNRALALDEQGSASLTTMHAVALNELAFVYDYFDNGSAEGIPALRWDVARTLEFFGRVCRAVAALHELGLTHRSLKPSNVLVDDALHPVLADPGMIGLRDPSVAVAAADATYRAPEELGGESTQSPTADVYGLGRLLWFLLLGSDPDEPYESFAKLTSLDGCPPGLVRIVRKATAHDPAARYQWVEELEADLAIYAKADLVGLAGSSAEEHPRYCISSLPAPAPKRAAAFAVEIRGPTRERATEPTGKRAVERAIAWTGLASVVVATALLALLPVPSPFVAEAFGVVATLGLAACTLFLRPIPQRPLLGRFVVSGVALALLVPFELERLAVLRWKVTLEHGRDEARAHAARFLAREGEKNLQNARLSGSDLRRADFGRADLRMANLSRANLVHTNLSEADLRGANVSGADVSGADLRLSSIPEATGWLDARCNRLTGMPRSWACVDGRPRSQ
jgi:serine/threonine-protein kinase